MKAVILGAGQGTRLKKYTENLPKGMLLFMGKTVIERQIELYRTCGIDKIIIVKGFAADKIGYEGVTYYTNEAYAETNMVESLMAAKEEFDDDIIVSYSDILFEKRLLKGMMASPADFAVAVDDDWKAYWKKRYGKENFDTESLSIDENGNITEITAEYDPDSRGGDPADGRKVKGATLHWVDARTAVDAEVRIYDNLFTVDNPEEGDFLEYLNPDSLEVLTGCKAEASLANAKPGESYQFMRQGYFCADNRDSKPGNLVFNRSVKLKDGFKPGK